MRDSKVTILSAHTSINYLFDLYTLTSCKGNINLALHPFSFSFFHNSLIIHDVSKRSSIGINFTSWDLQIQLSEVILMDSLIFMAVLCPHLFRERSSTITENVALEVLI